MNKVNGLSVLLAAAILVTFLVGCDGNNQSTEQSSSGRQESTATSAATKPSAAQTPTQGVAEPDWNTEDADVNSNNNAPLAIDFVRRGGKPLGVIDEAAAIVVKSPWKYYGKLLCASGLVNDVADYAPGSEDSKNLAGADAQVVISTEDDTTLDYLLVGSSGQIKDGDTANLCGYPIGRSENENRLGGKDTVLMIVGSIDLKPPMGASSTGTANNSADQPNVTNVSNVPEAQSSDASSSASAERPVIGEYHRYSFGDNSPDNSTATITVVEAPGGSLAVKGESTWVGDANSGNVNTGEIDGPLQAHGNNFVYSDSDSDCQLTLAFSQGELVVSDDNGQCGGMNVTFNGKYRKPSASSADSTRADNAAAGPIRPSFDCAKASSAVEHMICSDQELADDDLHLMESYKAALRTSTDKDVLKQAQNAWRTGVRDVCTDKQCVDQAYKTRMGELEAH